MPITPSRRAIAWLFTLCLLALAACTSRPPAAPFSPFEQDVIDATDGLAAQWHGKTPWRLRWPASRLALGPFVDLSAAPARDVATFAQPQTLAAVKARQIVARQVSTALSEFDLVDAAPGADPKAELLLSASLIPVVYADGHAPAKPPLMLTLVLLDIQTRTVVARWQSPLRSESADVFPSAFESASPVLINQSALEKRAALFSASIAATVDAPSVGEALGLSRLAQAQAAYATGRYDQALALYKEAAASSPDQALRAWNGQYLIYLKLGQAEAAQQAFKQVVAAGLASGRLGVKLLFAPGQTEFWTDPEVSSAYVSWLAEISAQAAAAPGCLEVSGHTSRSGTETFNLNLSVARSERVRQIMLGDQAALKSRLQATGKGWSENIVGSGSDDARDAVDRRVEFKVADCAAKS
jgi:outer membrane protein OmpA-like peptidoglycan-associated protein